MKKSLIILIIFISFSACKKLQVVPSEEKRYNIPWTDTSSNHPKHAAFKTLIDKYVKKGLPGISLLVNDRSGTWIGSAGKADLQTNVAFTPGTVSKVASITKLFMGVLTFKMMEDSLNTGIGYKSLNQPITNWIPKSITDKLPNGNQVTLGQCMKHETGIPDLINESKFYLAVLNNPVKQWQAEELLEFIYNKEAMFSPGDNAVYSNTNTILVSLVLESATGKKHSELLKQYILHPLDLNDTYYQPHDELPSNVSQGYFDLYNNGTIVNVSNLVTGSGNGYGGIFSNIFDLFKFIDALLLKKSLLTPLSLNIMQTFGKREDNNEYGYGIEKTFTDRGVNNGYGHAGRDLGYTANLYYFPHKGVTHTFLINYGTDAKSSLRDIFYEFQDELIDITLQ